MPASKKSNERRGRPPKVRRGRPPKARRGRPPKVDKTSKVSPKEKHEEPVEDEEVWDMDRTVSSEEARRCRMEGCGKESVAVWSSNLHKDDKWDVCEGCQLKEFGGWPEEDDNNDEEEGSEDNKDVEEKSENEDALTGKKEHEESTKKAEIREEGRVDNEDGCIKNNESKAKVPESGNGDKDMVEGDEETEEDDKGQVEDRKVKIEDSISSTELRLASNDKNTNNVTTSGKGRVEDDLTENDLTENDLTEDDEAKTEDRLTTTEACLLNANENANNMNSNEEGKVEDDKGRAEDDKATAEDSVHSREPRPPNVDENANNIDSNEEGRAEDVTLEDGNGMVKDRRRSTELHPPNADETINHQNTSKISDPESSAKTNSSVANKVDHEMMRDEDEHEGIEDEENEVEHEEIEDAEDEMWELKEIIPLADLTKEYTIKCSTEDCCLPACCTWISNLAPTTKWYSCLDCQEKDFEGWPPVNEIPVDNLTPDHMHEIAEKCSKKRKPTMPSFPPAKATSPSSKEMLRSIPNFVTPPPSLTVSSQGSDESSGNVHRATKTSRKPTQVTVPKSIKPSAGALAMHKKWQDAAEAMGGKEARIVVSKPSAKKLIFDLLFDAFAPMNITQIYKKLKAVVPSPVLSTCLKDMAFDKSDNDNLFADSDDEEEMNKPKENDVTESYAGSLFFKAGKNQNTNLYYVDHTKLKRCDRDERERLAGETASARAEEASLSGNLRHTMDEVARLLSEPTNEEAATRLEEEESSIAKMNIELQAARKLKVNENHKRKTKRRIQNMAVHWRRRKRLCMDFLISLEENTDGAVRVKKCLSGDGQIALDSDEIAASSALQYAKDKHARATSRRGSSRAVMRSTGKTGLGISLTKANSGSSSLADEAFVAVRLDSQNTVQRVYLDEDE